MLTSVSSSSTGLSTTPLSRKFTVPYCSAAKNTSTDADHSDYASRVFGFETFGKVYGLIICLSGLFNFAQSGLDALTHSTFHNDPLPVNLILLVSALVVGIALVGFVWTKSRSIERAQLEQEAEEADERAQLVPGADERVREDRHPLDVHGGQGGYGT